MLSNDRYIVLDCWLLPKISMSRLTDRSGEQPMDDDISVSSDGWSEVGIDGDREAVVNEQRLFEGARSEVNGLKVRVFELERRRIN